MSKEMLEALRDAVRVRGMRAFITHETIAKDVVSVGFSSGREKLEAWNIPLTNCDGEELVAWLNLGSA